MRFNQSLQNVLVNALESGATPFLVGEAGIGKTQFAKHLVTNILKDKFWTITANQLSDVGDLCGVRTVLDPATNTYRQEFFPHAIITEVIQYATANPTEHPTVLIDEVNRCASDITSALLSLILEHRLGDKVIPENVRFIAAGNDDGNIYDLDSASLSRFFVLHVQPDVNTLRGLKTWTPIMQTVLSTATDADILQIPAESNGFVNITTPRTIDKLDNFLNQLGQVNIDKLVQDNNFAEVVVGFLGTTTFSEKVVMEAANNCAAGQNTQMQSQFNSWTIDTGDYISHLTANATPDIGGLASATIDFINSQRGNVVHPVTDIVNNFSDIFASIDAYMSGQGAKLSVQERQSLMSEFGNITNIAGCQVQPSDSAAITLNSGKLSVSEKSILRVGLSGCADSQLQKLAGII